MKADFRKRQVMSALPPKSGHYGVIISWADFFSPAIILTVAPVTHRLRRCFYHQLSTKKIANLLEKKRGPMPTLAIPLADGSAGRVVSKADERPLP